MKTLVLLLMVIVTLKSAIAQNLTDTVPYPFWEVQREGQNRVMPIHDGVSALKLRLDLISRAKRNIEVEYFIYNTDMAGKIVTRELVRAAQRGVKVRLLIDKSKPIFKFDEFYAKALAEFGIEVRYYNDAPLYRISTVQFRNHRKLLTIDDEEGITGGRNIGDDYFDLSNHFNFNDRDVYVKGPIVKVMRESFDQFFDHKISERPDFPQEPRIFNKEKYVARTMEVADFLKETDEELRVRQYVEESGNRILGLTRLYDCPETSFASDVPGADFKARLSKNFDMKYKFLRKALYDKVQAVDRKITISSPYMINNKNTRELMNMLLDRKVEIELYTNSLASTDAVYVAANLYVEMFNWRKRGITIHLHDGKWLNDNPDIPADVRMAKWGTHDKTQVYETSNYSEVMIGTYNIDNRSNFYNAEMALFCKGNDEFSEDVKQNIMSRAYKGITINEDRTATDRDGNVRSVYGSSKKDLPLMRAIFLPSWLLKFLL